MVELEHLLSGGGWGLRANSEGWLSDARTQSLADS